MKNKTQRNHPILQGNYENAFTTLFGCGKSDFEIKENWENGPMLVKYNNLIYRIENGYDIDKQVEGMLTDFEEAKNIPINQWVEIAEDVHIAEEFYKNLLPSLNSNEYQNLNLALNISITTKSTMSFWYTIHEVDELELYPKAILAAAKTYDLRAMMDELSQLLILNGFELLNEMQNGIFETIDIDESDNTNNSLFYIYNVDPICW